MTRLKDWRARWDVFLAGTRHWRFDGRGMHCAAFVAAGVRAMTGIDHAARWQVAGTVEAQRDHLRAAGYADEVALVASLLPEIEPRAARAGDVGVLDDGVLALVHGAELLIGLGERGPVLIDRARMVRAFEV